MHVSRRLRKSRSIRNRKRFTQSLGSNLRSAGSRKRQRGGRRSTRSVRHSRRQRRTSRGGSNNTFTCMSIDKELACDKACDGKNRVCIWKDKKCHDITEGTVTSNGTLDSVNEFSGFAQAVNTNTLKKRKCSDCNIPTNLCKK